MTLRPNAPLLVLAFVAAMPSIAAADVAAGALCGQSGDIPSLLLALQKPATESLWRDKTMFVLKDGDDGTLWAFSIKNSTVHPAVRCRRSTPTGEAGQICNAAEVGEKACASFASQADARFDALSGSNPAAR